MSRAGVALIVLYAVCCMAASVGLAMAFGIAAQLIAMPLFALGGVVLGSKIAR
jgi:hypothetical protein